MVPLMVVVAETTRPPDRTYNIASEPLTSTSVSVLLLIEELPEITVVAMIEPFCAGCEGMRRIEIPAKSFFDYNYNTILSDYKKTFIFFLNSAKEAGRVQRKVPGLFPDRGL